MDRLPPVRAATRTLAQHLDARDLRAAIVEALAARQIRYTPDTRVSRNDINAGLRIVHQAVRVESATR